jgi:hypothetical protein
MPGPEVTLMRSEDSAIDLPTTHEITELIHQGRNADREVPGSRWVMSRTPLNIRR